jgi:hypothetical protein
MTADRRTAVATAQEMLGLSLEQLWVDTLALGGRATLFELGRFVAGLGDLSAHEYDVVAQALNDRFLDEGSDHPVPYSDTTE